MQRIGFLIGLAADDREWQARGTAFVQGLQELGWSNSRKVRIDTRWSLGDALDKQSFGILPAPVGVGSWAQSKRWRRRAVWS